jgi:uncharacterized protein (TIGR03435 family)
MIQKIAFATFVALISSNALGQSKLSFDSATIKRSNASQEGFLDFSPGGDRLTATSITLGGLLMVAYNVTVRQVSGPISFLTEKYDVEAKVEHKATRGDMSRMLQALVEERFKLSLHRETKDVSFRALVVGRGGPKLHRSEGAALSSPFRLGSKESGHVIGQHESMPDFVLSLSTIRDGSDLVVTDKTGLEGNFDFDLRFTPQYQKSSSGPSIFTALREQLGLELELQTGPIEFLVVDHVERHADN